MDWRPKRGLIVGLVCGLAAGSIAGAGIAASGTAGKTVPPPPPELVAASTPLAPAHHWVTASLTLSGAQGGPVPSVTVANPTSHQAHITLRVYGPGTTLTCRDVISPRGLGGFVGSLPSDCLRLQVDATEAAWGRLDSDQPVVPAGEISVFQTINKGQDTLQSEEPLAWWPAAVGR